MVENQKRVDKLLQNKVTKNFFPGDESYSDVYSFGKTMQYILAKSSIQPKLTKKEEKKLQKIISKSTNIQKRKKSYQSFEKIQEDI